MERVETGVVQFEYDWPGIFIRGDNAIGFSCHLKAIETFLAAPNLGKLPGSVAMGAAMLKNLINLLDSCNLSNNTSDIQHIRREEPKN